jgi:peptide/nickel transport system permease protein
MWRTLTRQTIGVVSGALASTFLVFGALYVAPGNPITFLSAGRQLSPEATASLKAQYHLDQPFLERYWSWLTAAIHGDFGQSIVSRTSVNTLLGPRVGTTLLLFAMATVLMVTVGVAVGVFAGLRGRRADLTAMSLATVGLAVPAFVTAVVLIYVFAVELGWFPVFGAGSGFIDRIYHLVLPSIALAAGGVAYVARVTRVSVRAERSSEHVMTARARGLPDSLVIRRHVLRNALIPITTVSGLAIAGLLATSIVVENAFGLGGLGSLLIQAVGQHDFAVVQAVALIFVVGLLLINLLIDVLYTVIDPRVRGVRS